MKVTTTSTPAIPLLLTGITAILCILLLLYIHIVSKSTSQKFVPWVGASIEIKLETALAHLWFEGSVGNNSNSSIKTVDQHLTLAKWYATAILDGGRNEQDIYYPLEDDELRIQVNQLLYSLQQFHHVAHHQYNSSNSVPVSNHQLSILFSKIMKEASTLEDNLKQHIAHKNSSQNTLLFMLFIAICTMFFVSTYSIWRFTNNKTRYLKQLSAAHTQISKQYSTLKALAHTDQLTGIPNRKMLETLAHQALSKVRRQQSWLSMTFIDLDFFKPINDQFGHNIGDKVLINFTKAIKAQLRKGDTLARLAGDEFILLIEADNEEDLIKSLDQIMSRVQKTLLQPILITPVDIHVRYSAGTAIAPKNSIDFEMLMHFADLAMYESKKNGRGQHCYYHETREYQKELAFHPTETDQEASTL